MTEQEKFDALINLWQDIIRLAYLTSVKKISNSLIEAELVRQIEQNNVEAAFEILGLSKASLRPFTRAVEDAFDAGGEYASLGYPKYINTPSGRMVFQFDVRNERAEKWLKEHSSSLVTNIVEETRTNVRDIMTSGLERGQNPRKMALDIAGRYDPLTKERVGGVIGLTTNQESWTRSYRNKLENLSEESLKMGLRDKRFDKTVAKAVAEGKPLTVETIDKLVVRYRGNALKFRAETIGRTESITALNKADYESVQQLIDSGAVRQRAIELEWDDVGDRRTRHEHRTMNGQRVPYGTPFTTPSGHKMLHPHDTSLGATGADVINCRCRVKKRIDYFDAVR